MAWPGLRSDLLTFFGLDFVIDTLSRMEPTMARINDALNALVAQQQDASAAQLVSFSNLQTGVDRLKAVIDRLQTEVENPQLTEEAQAAMDQLTTGFAQMTQQAQAADDIVEEPTPAPTDGGMPTDETTPDAGQPTGDTTGATER
jgi:methyl-accepting chemotaxis protein